MKTNKENNTDAAISFKIKRRKRRKEKEKSYRHTAISKNKEINRDATIKENNRDAAIKENKQNKTHQ